MGKSLAAMLALVLGAGCASGPEEFDFPRELLVGDVVHADEVVVQAPDDLPSPRESNLTSIEGERRFGITLKVPAIEGSLDGDKSYSWRGKSFSEGSLQLAEHVVSKLTLGQVLSLLGRPDLSELRMVLEAYRAEGRTSSGGAFNVSFDKPDRSTKAAIEGGLSRVVGTVDGVITVGATLSQPGDLEAALRRRAVPRTMSGAYTKLVAKCRVSDDNTNTLTLTVRDLNGKLVDEQSINSGNRKESWSPPPDGEEGVFDGVTPAIGLNAGQRYEVTVTAEARGRFIRQFSLVAKDSNGKEIPLETNGPVETYVNRAEFPKIHLIVETK